MLKSPTKLQYESKEEMLMQFKEEKHYFLSGLIAWALISSLVLIGSIFIF